jgi:hypothetical protein
VSIVRVGLAETKRFSEGYEAIFGKKTKSAETPKKAKKTTAKAKASTAKKKKVKKK